MLLFTVFQRGDKYTAGSDQLPAVQSSRRVVEQDDILADDEKMMEASIEDTIGHEVMGLLINNPYSYSLYVRYPTLGADYEVKMDPGSFADAFKELDVGGTD